MSTQVIVTPYTDANPSPRCEVFVQDPPAGSIVNITRTADRRTMQVRSAVNVPAGSGVSRIDAEAPFGVSITYQAEIIAADGTSSFVTAAPAMLNVNESWISQPLDPRLAVRVDLTDESATDIHRGFDGESVTTDGASVGRWIGGRRKGLTNLKLVVETSSNDDADELQDIFGTYDTDQSAVICVRTPPTLLRLPRVLFMAVPDPTENDISVRYGGSLTAMTLTGDEVLPTAPGLAAALLRYGDTDAFFGSYAAIDAAYGSYLARDRDYAKAGYAG